MTLRGSGLWIETLTGSGGTAPQVKSFFGRSSWLHGQQNNIYLLRKGLGDILAVKSRERYEITYLNNWSNEKNINGKILVTSFIYRSNKGMTVPVPYNLITIKLHVEININKQLCYILLKGWSLLPNALWPFQIYCALPNLGIRTWICRLDFC